MMRQVFRRLAFATLAGIMTVSCGGGGGGGSGEVASGGIGGTGISTGTISGFGSIFVNGVELDISSAAITVDDTPALEGNLKLGMVVIATVNLNSDGMTGTAISVAADDDLEGPIDDAPLPDVNGLSKIFTSLGTTVIVDKNDTVFDDTFAGFDFDTIAQGDVVEVRGFFDENDALRAEYIEKKGVSAPGVPLEVEVKGTISQLSSPNAPGTFAVRGLTVSFDANTDLSDLPGGLANDLFVEVKGTLPLQPDGSLLADEIELEGIDDDVENVSVHGIVTNFNGLGDFVVNSGVGPVRIDASGATLVPTGLFVADGAEVEVEGSIVGGVLQALEVEARGGEIKIEAPVFAVNNIDGKNGDVTLEVVAPGQAIVVTVNDQTRMEDDRDDIPGFSLADISVGDFLRVKGFEIGGGNVVATDLDRDGPDDIILQGRVEDATGSNNTGTVTILGATFSTVDGLTQIDDKAGSSLPGDFFAQVSVGDLLRVRDDMPGDGVADGIKFE